MSRRRTSPQTKPAPAVLPSDVLPLTAARPIKITEDDRETILGFEGRRTAAIAEAEAQGRKLAEQLAAQALARINESAERYFRRLEQRLELPENALMKTHVINVGNLTVSLRASEPSQAGAESSPETPAT